MSSAHGATHRGPSLPTSGLRRSALSVRSASTSGTLSAKCTHNRPVEPSPNRRSLGALLDNNPSLADLPSESCGNVRPPVLLRHLHDSAQRPPARVELGEHVS